MLSNYDIQRIYGTGRHDYVFKCLDDDSKYIVRLSYKDDDKLSSIHLFKDNDDGSVSPVDSDDELLKCIYDSIKNDILVKNNKIIIK